MKYIAFIRTSSEDFTEQQSAFNYQQRIINKFARTQDFQIVKTIKEVSSHSNSKSTKLIIDCVRKLKVEAVICSSFDRIANDPEEFKYLRYLLEVADVKLITADTGEVIGLLPPYDKAIQSLNEAIRILVSEEQSRRIKQGLERRKNGKRR